MFYNNDCGRYQPDTADSDYLATQIKEFGKMNETASASETGGDPKTFYRDKDHSSAIVVTGFCRRCNEQFDQSDLRRYTDGYNYCYAHFPIDDPYRSPCMTCSACYMGYDAECPALAKPPRRRVWDAAPFPNGR